MNPSLTELILIVDRSGSMSHLQAVTLDLTVALFDTTVEIFFEGVRIKDAKKKVLSTRNYRPDGCTALHDAVATGESIGLDRDDAQLWSSTPEGMEALQADMNLSIN